MFNVLRSGEHVRGNVHINYIESFLRQPHREEEDLALLTADDRALCRISLKAARRFMLQGAAKSSRSLALLRLASIGQERRAGPDQGSRIAAPEIEHRVAAAARAILCDRPALALAPDQPGLRAHRLLAVLKAAPGRLERPGSKNDAAAALGELVARVELNRDSLQLSLKLPVAPAQPSDPIASLVFAEIISTQMKRRGSVNRVILEGCATPNPVDLPLLKAVARGRKWSQDFLAGRAPSCGIARREQVAARYVRELLPLGFLASTTIEAIVAGRQPPDLTVIQLLHRLDLPLLWSA